jgi:competence protein ComEC
MYAQSLTWPGKDWAVVNCDVGQGDGLVINLGKGQAIVIDAGPDPILISRCLRALHIHQIPLVVLTHFHADHIAGLSGILKTAKVKSAWVSNSVEPAPEYARTISALASIPITVVHQGQHITFPSDLGLVKIDVWWPGSEIDTSINNSSVALYIEIHGLRIFASGDIEPPAQEAIMKSGMVRPVDILKVAHHGSRFQDYELMDALAPQLALISVGAGNSYGHPSPETLAALTQRHIRVRRSDQDGAIASDARLRIRTNKREWWRISWG